MRALAGVRWVGLVVTVTVTLALSTMLALTTTAAHAAPSLGIGNPGRQQTEPGTPVSLKIPNYEPDPSATVSFSAANLPPGLTIDPSTGVISGTTSSTIAAYDVLVTVTDSAQASASTEFTWDVWNLITVTAPSVQSFAGVPVTVTVSATDSAPGRTLTFGSSDLPSWLSLDPATGVISGTPTSARNTAYQITVTDGTGSAGSTWLNWKTGGVITFSPIQARTIGAGQGVDLPPVPVQDNVANDNVSFSATGLPPGILMFPNGATNGSAGNRRHLPRQGYRERN